MHYQPSSEFYSRPLFDIKKVFLQVSIIGATILLLGIARDIYVHIYKPSTAFSYLPYFSTFRSSNNLLSWFQSCILLLIGMTFAVIATQVQRSADGASYRWRVLAGIFFFTSADEAINVHQAVLGQTWVSDLSPLLFAQWLPVLIIIAIAIYLLPLSRGMTPFMTVRFVISGGLFVFGAVICEIVSSTMSMVAGAGSSNYVFAAIAEEAFETIGVVCILMTALNYSAMASDIKTVSGFPNQSKNIQIS